MGINRYVLVGINRYVLVGINRYVLVGINSYVLVGIKAGRLTPWECGAFLQKAFFSVGCYEFDYLNKHPQLLPMYESASDKYMENTNEY